MSNVQQATSFQAAGMENRHYRELLWSTVGRMTLLYFVPLLLLALFFVIQYRRLARESLGAE